jgi:beta-fructofuranosidase
MTLSLPDKWVWDFWLAEDGGETHIFYLQAPRSLGRPTLRHRHASIGHAVSDDLVTWRVLPDALHPGPPGSWDDISTWTGSVIRHDGQWKMLYTGISSEDDGLVQRVGLAESDDLITWRKHPANPVLEADPRWYELLDLARWRDQSWRDPLLFRLDGDEEHLHVLMTARASTGEADEAGVVAHARSRDLIDWEVLPPVMGPGEFAQVEAPQLVDVGGRTLLVFSSLGEDHSRRRRARVAAPYETGTFVASAPGPLGPYALATGPIGPGAGEPPLYAGRLVETAPGEWCLIAFAGHGDDDFVGELTDPLPVEISAEGVVLVEQTAPRP